MAATAWTFYNRGKHYIGSADIDLNGATFRLTLHTSASNASTQTLSTYSQLTGEVASGNGYSSSGKALSGVTWTTGASASEQRFDCTAQFWSANGGNIVSVKYAVISTSTLLLCWTRLTTASFTLADGNRLTITPNATNGIFELN